MEKLQPTTDWPALHSMPEVAGAIRLRESSIVSRWEAVVRKRLPDAAHLTLQQVGDSIPRVLDKLVRALETAAPHADASYFSTTREHGADRYRASYKIDQLVEEYGLLRGILADEVGQAMGAPLALPQLGAIDEMVDIALQQAVLAYSEGQDEQLQSITASQSKYHSFLSHDLRNHLNSAMLTMEVLARRLSKLPDFQEDVEDIRSLQRAMRETVTGMEDVVQAERARRKGAAARSGATESPPPRT